MSTPRWLVLLLAGQLLLALIFWWPQDRSAQRARPLLDLAAESITSIAIATEPQSGEPISWLELTRQDEGWVVTSEQGYPANPRAVETLVDRLLGMRVRQPIATHSSSHNALRVGDDEFGRRVRIGTSEGEHELVISAAASNTVNARLVDSDDVFVATGLSEWSLHDRASSYWSTDYVKVTPDEISEIQVRNSHGDFHAIRDEAGWLIDDLDDDEVSDSAALEKWLADVASLRMLRPLSSAPTAFPSADEQARISWTIQAESETIGGGYALATDADGRLLAKSDSHAFVVEVSKRAADALLEIAREDLVRERPDPAEIETDDQG